MSCITYFMTWIQATGQQDLLVTEVVVSDGIAVLVDYAWAKSPDISDPAIVCLRCIARADKRYRTAIRALTHDKALDEKIFPGKLSAASSARFS